MRSFVSWGSMQNSNVPTPQRLRPMAHSNLGLKGNQTRKANDRLEPQAAARRYIFPTDSLYSLGRAHARFRQNSLKQIGFLTRVDSKNAQRGSHAKHTDRKNEFGSNVVLSVQTRHVTP